MTPARFRAIVDAYGATPARWPAAEREAALRFAAGRPEEAAILHRAETLDRLLAAHRVEPAATALAGRILAGAPAARRGGWFSAGLRRGAAFAGLGLAGALAGALAVAVALPVPGPDSADEDGYAVTAFGGPVDVDGD